MNKLLILGGSNFIGRNLVEQLLELNRFDITLFNRGKTNTQLFPELNKIVGDRHTSDIQQLNAKNWDYIIDLSCYYPDALERVLDEVNKSSLKRYIFISTCSVYDNELNQSVMRNEDAPTLSCTAEERSDSSPETYGKRKAECERMLIQSGLAYSIFRPALVYGPYDNTDRFYYWLYQVKQEKPLLMPNGGKSLFSVTFVEDLVQAIIMSLQPGLESCIFNASSFPQMSISRLVHTASQLLEKEPEQHFADAIFLKKQEVAQWTDLPLWLDCDYFTYNNQRMLRELKVQLTGFKESVAKTIAHYDTLGWKEPEFGMSEEVKNGLILGLKNESE